MSANDGGEKVRSLPVDLSPADLASAAAEACGRTDHSACVDGCSIVLRQDCHPEAGQVIAYFGRERFLQTTCAICGEFLLQIAFSERASGGSPPVPTSTKPTRGRFH